MPPPTPPPLSQRARPRANAPWLDPDLASTMETDASEKLVPGQPSSAPDRVTIYVPAETTYLNLGEQVGQAHERGIHGHTEHHIHFWTTKTKVMLGQACKLFPGHVGYSLQTSENAYHHADRQHCFQSRDEDILFRTACDKVAVLQSDAGTTEVTAKKNVTFTAGDKLWISAGSYSPVTTTYAEPWVHAGLDAGVSSHLAKVVDAAYIAQTFISGIGSLAFTFLKCAEGDASWSTSMTGALVKAALSGAKMLAAATGFGSTAKSIHVSGDVGVGISGVNVGLFAPKLASVSSIGAASFIGGTVEYKGWGLAGVWAGLDATLTSFKEVGVSSPFGTVNFDAASDCSFVSDGPVRVYGDDKVSLRSAHSTATAYGASQCYVGSLGYGLFVDGSSVGLGQTTSGKKFGAPGLDKKHAIVLDENQVRAQYGKSYALVSGQHDVVQLKANNNNSVRVTKDGVHVKGKEIHLE